MRHDSPFWIKISVIYLAFCGLVPVQAQNGAPPLAGAKSAAMGGAGVALTDIHSAFSNQAGLAFLSETSILATAERRFLLDDLQTFSLAAAYPAGRSGAFGLTLHYFGFEIYNEKRIGLAYARSLIEDRLAIGAQFLFLNTQIQEYGSKGNVTFELGLTSKVNSQVTIGVHVFSPARVELVDQEFLPTVFNIGLGYMPSEKVTFLLEAEKDVDFPIRARAGLEYFVVKPLAIRIGAATNPTLLSFGVGLNLGNGLGIDLSSYYHQWLGFTPGISLRYTIDRKS